MMPDIVWLIFLLPLTSFVIISLFVRPFANRRSRISGYITILAVGGSLIISLLTLHTILSSPEHSLEVTPISWLKIGGQFYFNVGLMIDSLTGVMLVVVTIVSLMVQIYSLGYMKDDPAGYHRYYAWMSLFTMSMLGLVMADSLLFMYIFWEMVGLCSYLLIGFWFHKPSAANAAKKAFIVTRLGDFGFLVGILILYANTGTFNINELHTMAMTGLIAGSTLTWAAIGIFAGAVGKSAQFPLHVWLPDAMEGPTPVSALIHAATMVAAGVFLVARTLPLFVNSIPAITTVACIGGFTAIFAATMGLVMNDIKRVIAYSTISQLGYMMLGLGVAGLAVAHELKANTQIPNIEAITMAKAAATLGIFHLFNHAFFKALLFLGAGSVNHATNTFDMRLMGGLRKAMPWTYTTFIIAAISLAGIWPFAGFWSKDEILKVSLEQQPILFTLAMITVFMTAFYIFRVVFLTFHGEYRGGTEDGTHNNHQAHHLHESPAVMTIPMVILAILAIISGLWNANGDFNKLMSYHEPAPGLFSILTHPLPWIAMITAGAGILLAYAVYARKWIPAEKIGNMFKPFYNLAYRKYYFDEFYENIIVKQLLLGGLFWLCQKIDTYVIDGIVNGIANLTMATGRILRKWQTGQLQLYGLFTGIGVIIIILLVFLIG